MLPKISVLTQKINRCGQTGHPFVLANQLELQKEVTYRGNGRKAGKYLSLAFTFFQSRYTEGYSSQVDPGICSSFVTCALLLGSKQYFIWISGLFSFELKVSRIY